MDSCCLTNRFPNIEILMLLLPGYNVSGTSGSRPRIDFGGVSNAISINANGNLTFQDLIISGTKTQNGLDLQDYKNLPRMGGLAQWPSIVAQVGSTVRTPVLVSVSACKLHTFTRFVPFGAAQCTHTGRAKFRLIEHAAAFAAHSCSAASEYLVCRVTRQVLTGEIVCAGQLPQHHSLLL